MSDQDHKPADGKKGIFDDPKVVDRVLYALYGACALVFAADFVIHKHPHFENMENLPNFFGFYGFVCFVLVVFGGVLLRKLVMRDEDYYDR